MVMATRKQEGSGPRSEAKAERRRYLAGLFYKGVAYSNIYRIMCARFGVTEQTVRKDIRAIGAARKRHMENEEELEAKVEAVESRLNNRAQRDDAVGNQADGLLLNLYGNRSARKLQESLAHQTLKLKEAQTAHARATAERVMIDTDRAKLAAESNQELVDIMRRQTDRIIENRGVTFRDLIEMAAVFMRKCVEQDASDTMMPLKYMNMLLRIVESNPGSDAADQFFRLPEGMPIEMPPADDGDDLLA